jgi:CRISPR-associated protein Csx14
MAGASIPVDLHNPGQVFACLGFLEAAEVLLGRAEGGFDWTHETAPCFALRAGGEDNPFRVVLGFLAEAGLQRLAPIGYMDLPELKAKAKGKKIGNDTLAPGSAVGDSTAADGPLCEMDTFPAPQTDRKTLPVRLVHDGRQLDLTHWCDGSSRNSFKLFAGPLRGSAIALQMLDALRQLWYERQDDVIKDPFGLTVPLGGSSFKFDARKAWTTIGAGFSPDMQGNAVEASPIVEILAAVGMEHARPYEFGTRQVRYAVWKGLLPPVLARAVLGGIGLGVPSRIFRFTLDLSGKNKNVTFAQEETSL